MHDRQYRDYRSGVAKKRFEQELEAEKVKANAPIVNIRPVVEMPHVDVDEILAKYPNAKPIQSPVKGKMLWEYDLIDSSSAPIVGTAVKENNLFCFIQTYYGNETVRSPYTGKVLRTCVKQGAEVQKGQILAFVD